MGEPQVCFAINGEVPLERERLTIKEGEAGSLRWNSHKSRRRSDGKNRLRFQLRQDGCSAPGAGTQRSREILSEASIFPAKQEARSSTEGESRARKCFEKHGEIYSNHGESKLTRKTQWGCQGSTAGPYKDVDHEPNVILSLPVMWLPLVESGWGSQ